MAAIDFPASPTTNQVFDPGGGLPRYIWTGTVWNSYGSIANRTWVGTAAPASPLVNDLWWNPDTTALSLYYNDGSTTQWVQIG